jgi:AcrR family transcriptional regulator
MVTERGVDGLSLRALAAGAGTSTTAVYSLFGSKADLLRALFEESFRSFGDAQREVVTTGRTIDDLAALGRAYWAWARAHPHLYGVMFSQALSGIEPTPEQAATAASAIEPLATVVRAGVDNGELRGDPATITFSLWASVHGVVSLTLADCAPPDDHVQSELFDATMRATTLGWLAARAVAAG